MGYLTNEDFFDIKKALKESVRALWEDLYPARIPWVDDLPDNYLKEFGLPLSGDRDVDQTVYRQWNRVEISIDSMIEKYKRGITVRIINHDDTKTIYDAITHHLNLWKRLISNGTNVGIAPIEELILMDEFAGVVYPHAKEHFTREMIDTLLMDKMPTDHVDAINSLFQAGGLKLTDTLAPVKEKEHIDRFGQSDKDKDDRVSYSEDFKKVQLKLRQWR